ncbi:MAG: type II toxin-antitoxin system RelE/ParE family toxin [Candidatus Hydrogenedentes bacterium]|nr:type II toxin-antitoxin system RelE/ParE family toxin [Candidatus Hydrogenedentota bacterium]
MYRKRMQFILNAPDERSFRTMKSFHFEELRGDRQGQHSIRLNRQYRLVFRFEGVSPEKRLVVLAVEDYH